MTIIDTRMKIMTIMMITFCRLIDASGDPKPNLRFWPPTVAEIAQTKKLLVNI